MLEIRECVDLLPGAGAKQASKAALSQASQRSLDAWSKFAKSEGWEKPSIFDIGDLSGYEAAKQI